MGFCKSNQKNMPVVGLLTHNDCDVLRAKTGIYRRVTHRTIILPTPDLLPTIPDQMHRPWKHPGGSKHKDQIRQPELGCKTQTLVSVHHHI